MSLHRKKGKRIALQALKLIGVLLFIRIVTEIDAEELVRTLNNADPALLAAGGLAFLFSLFTKAMRWHGLSIAAAPWLNAGTSWKIFHIGVFLSIITPAKLGEAGRIGYLKRENMPVNRAIAILLMDRAADVACILLLGIIGVGVLFGWAWTGLGALLILVILLLLLPFISMIQPVCKLFGSIVPARYGSFLAHMGVTTVAAWALYFLWAALLARALGITVELPVLVAILTLTGLVAQLPLAPSGLGTRDAALFTLLTPYGVTPAETVALGMLMFVSIVAGGIPGGWYWLTDRQRGGTVSHA